MVLYAGAQVGRGAVDAFPKPMAPVQIRLRLDRIRKILGLAIGAGDVESVLTRLEIPHKAAGAGQWDVSAPLVRPDLEREIDLVEEIARIHGYHEIPAKTRAPISFSTTMNRDERTREEIRNMLAGLGCCEVYCNSLSDEKEQLSFAPEIGPGDLVRLLNPLSPELSVLRASLIPGLARVAQWNRSRNIDDLQIFEIGRVFRSQGKDKLALEMTLVGGLFMGRRFPRGWYGDVPHDFGSVKGLLETLFERSRLSEITYSALSGKPFLAGESVAIRTGAQEIGFLGALSPSVCEHYDLKAPVFVFQILPDPLIVSCKAPRVFQSLPKFPPIDRDFAFVLDRGIPSEEVRSHIKGLSPLVECVEWFDLYEGKQVQAGKKSMAITIRMRSSERTLTETDAEGVSRLVIETVAGKFGGELRK